MASSVDWHAATLALHTRTPQATPRRFMAPRDLMIGSPGRAGLPWHFSKRSAIVDFSVHGSEFVARGLF